MTQKTENYSNIPEINTLLNKSIQHLCKSGYNILSHKNIQYGTNVEFSYSEISFILSIYYTQKNGFRLVFSKTNDSGIESEVKKILFAKFEIKDALKIKFERYIGMDEAGKGDYFGPLVIAGFIFDKSIEKDLIEIGVSDSKLLSDEKIKQITRTLLLKFPERTKIHEIKPPDYNKRINDLKKIKGNLNTLLAESYRDILLRCETDSQNFGAVIDKFAKEDFILKIIHKSLPDLKIVLAQNAERNLAVAAASILARAVFLKGIEEISNKFNLRIPLGAGKEVMDFARFFLNKFNQENLFSICKYHFKTTGTIENRLFR